MAIGRWRSFQSMDDLALGKAGIEQIRAADNMGDAHFNFIHRTGQMVAPDAIRPLEDKLTGRMVAVALLQTLNQVVKLIGGIGQAQSPGGRFVPTQGRMHATKAVVAAAWVAGKDFTPTTVAGVDIQLFKGCLVESVPLGLEDNAMPLEAKAFQGVQYSIRRPRYDTGWIDIIDANPPFSLMGAGVQIGGGGGDQRAEVKRPIR